MTDSDPTVFGPPILRVGTAELAVLFTDLPRPLPPPAPPVTATPPAGRPWRLLPVAVVAALMFATVVVTTHFVPFFVFPLLFLALFRNRRGFRPGYCGGARRY
ncbi:hypothetical protein ACIA8C_21645 [Nocardia sp. NPDC051321]|uniref:hypothetical protein n=1 Tax=Nocardia sp. NPDC051321 TaxID=3364323 RepID=UPI0037A32E1D